MEKIRRSPAGMYKTLYIMGSAGAGFLPSTVFQGGKDEIPHDLQWFFEETALFFAGQIKTIGSMYGILTYIYLHENHKNQPFM